MNKLNSKKIINIILQVVLILLGVVWVVIAKTTNINNMECFYKMLFGIPCIACGGTRCFLNFINFNFIESFKYHPAFFVTIIYIIIVATINLYNMIFKKHVAEKLYKSFIPFYVLLALFVIQYIIRVACFLAGVTLPFMYVAV